MQQTCEVIQPDVRASCRMRTNAVIGLLLAAYALVCNCQPVSKQKKPCSAARLHVVAPNRVAGSWIMLLGQLEGRVYHDTAGVTEVGEQAGTWESSLYNRDEDCTDNDVRIFEGRATGEAPVTVRPIPTDYVAVEGGGYYKWHQEPATWVEAQASCMSEGAALAVANSKPEAQALVAFMKFGNNSAAAAFHVGVYWSSKDEDFYTVAGIPLGQAGYEIWGRGQPDDYNDEQICVSMTTTGEMFDGPCTNVLPYLCEIDA